MSQNLENPELEFKVKMRYTSFGGFIEEPEKVIDSTLLCQPKEENLLNCQLTHEGETSYAYPEKTVSFGIEYGKKGVKKLKLYREATRGMILEEIMTVANLLHFGVDPDDIPPEILANGTAKLDQQIKALVTNCGMKAEVNTSDPKVAQNSKYVLSQKIKPDSKVEVFKRNKYTCAIKPYWDKEYATNEYRGAALVKDNMMFDTDEFKSSAKIKIAEKPKMFAKHFDILTELALTDIHEAQKPFSDSRDSVKLSFNRRKRFTQ